MTPLPSFKHRLKAWLILLLILPILTNGEPIIINGQPVYTFTGNNWSYLSTNSRSVIDIVQRYRAGNFILTGTEVFNGGIPRQYLWFHFEVTNRESLHSKLLIDIESPRINELELFEIDGGQVYLLGRCGDFYPFNKRHIQNKNFVFPISVKKGQSKEYFLFVNQVGHTLLLPVKVFTEPGFQIATAKNYLIDGITYGVLLFVAFFSLAFFFNTWYSLYLYYSLYIISAILWLLSYFGLGYQFIWWNQPWICTLSSPLLACSNIFLNIRICQILLQLKKVNGFMYKAGNWACGSLVVAGLFPFINLNNFGYTVNHTYLIIFLAIICLAILVVFFSIFLYSIKGSFVARFYFIASLLKVGSIFDLTLKELGFTKGIYHQEGMLQIGILIEISLLTAAIAQRYAIYKQKTIQGVIIGQEEERRRVAQEMHDGISNTLSAIQFKVEALIRSHSEGDERMQELKAIAIDTKGVQQEARNISHEMMPEDIEKETLSQIIENYIKKLQPRLKPLIIELSTNAQTIHLSEQVKLNILRIVQELTSNIWKHARATNAHLSISFSKKELLIASEDNGIGFHSKGTDTMGIGIKSIRSRIKILNGTLSITSPVKKTGWPSGTPGTLIDIRIPLARSINEKISAHEY
jgi:two-component system, sensor histidine kinase LadS